MLYCHADAVTKLEYSNWVFILPDMPIMAESKDQVFVDEQEIILHLRWVWRASKQKARAHVTSRLGNYSTLRGAGMFSL